MAFQSVNTKSTKEAVKLTGLAIGEAIEGYVVKLVPSKIDESQNNLFMQDAEGNTFYVYPSGNVKYMIADGKIKEGILTRIVRIANKDVKGKMSSQFDVLQDEEQTLSDVSFAALGGGATTTAAATNNSVAAAVTQASKTAIIKQQATKLANANKRG